MVNRADATGRYRSFESRRADPGKGVSFCDKTGLTRAKLAGHSRGIGPGDIVGPYSTRVVPPRPGVPGLEGGGFACKWGAIDIDLHDDA
jgi:hypothetical protein